MYTIINKYKFRQKYADVNQTPVPKHSGAGQSQISEACLDDVPEIFEEFGKFSKSSLEAGFGVFAPSVRDLFPKPRGLV